jgi:acyl-CoA thioesterase FadM
MDGLPQNEGLNALSSAANLKERPSLVKCGERPALYNDVDYNGHVNNVSYIRWIEDTLAGGLLEQAGRMRFDINYLSEILPGEVTGIWSAPIEDTGENTFYAGAFEGRKGEGGQAAFRAELRLWR